MAASSKCQKGICQPAFQIPDQALRQFRQSDLLSKLRPKQIKEIENQIGTLLGRIVETEGVTATKAYETKIEIMERGMVISQEKQAQNPTLCVSFGAMLFFSLEFSAKPWKV